MHTKALMSCMVLGLLITASPCLCIEKVRFPESFANGWEQYKGKTIRFDNPLVVIGLYYDSIVLAPERLSCPEEHATGLADGDSTLYKQLAEYNYSQHITLSTSCSPWELKTGCVVKHLTATVSGDRRLYAGKSPRFSKTKWNTALPDMGEYDILVCAANIQNYFYHLGGYASRRTTREQFALQTSKIAQAFTKANADIYAICELERGKEAIDTLVKAMNILAGKNIYSYIDNGFTSADMLMVGYIYRKDKIRPYGETYYAVQDTNNHYHYRLMAHGFEETASGKRFAINLNHTRSKHGTPWESNAKRMTNTDSILVMLNTLKANNVFGDEDILLVGDYNCHTQEQPIQYLVRNGYEDVLMRHAPEGYSYVFNSETGYLDRVFATPSMAEQVVSVQPWHVNADAYYSLGYKSKYANKGILRYADHDPILIGLKLK